MIENLTLPLLAGMALGGFFFGGLWWTVRKGSTATNPALWFMGSFILRTAGALAGFYAIGDNDWQRLLAALAGFVLARALLIRLTATPLPPSLTLPRKGGGNKKDSPLPSSLPSPLTGEGLGMGGSGAAAPQEANHAP